MSTVPEPPEVPDSQIGVGEIELRYDDLCQDGRMRIAGVWPPLGRILWTQMRVARALARLGARGIRNVLSFVVLEAADHPLTIRGTAHTEVRYRVAHTVDAAGQPNRIVFETWLMIDAPLGQLGDPTAPPSSERARVARAFGQHVFTRPGAKAGEHRVLELDDPDFPKVPAERVDFFEASTVLSLPAEAEPLDAVPRPDSAPLVFGLVHTDGNQHVNFLVYPRLTEEAALRRLGEHGIGGKLLGRRVEIGYRKPCFAGDRMRLVLQAYRLGDGYGVVAALHPDAGLSNGGVETPFSALGRPHCTLRLLLAP